MNRGKVEKSGDEGPKAPEQKTLLREMQDKLYGRSWKKESSDGVRSEYTSGGEELPSDWGRGGDLPTPAESLRDSSSMLWKILIGSIIFFLAALGAAAYFFLGGGNVVSSENVNIETSGPVTTAGGDELSLQISITNNNTAALQFTDLLVEFPEGTQEPQDVSRELPRFRKSLGVINPGETVNTIVRSVLFGEEGSKKDIHITLEYRVEGSNAIFVKDAGYQVSISSSPIRLSVETLKEINANQEMDVVVEISSNAERAINDIAVRIDYPFGFEPKEADPQPSIGQNVWEIGTIRPDESILISVRGVMRAQDEEEKIFGVYVGKQDASDSRRIATVYGSSFNQVLVSRPFLGVKMVLDGEEREEYVIESNRVIQGVLTWTNNTSARVVDAVVSMKITGDALNKFEVSSSQGFYDSISNTITWDKSREPRLAELAPGATGQLEFSFKTLPLFSSSAEDLRNPVLNIAIDAHGRRASEEGVMEKIESFVERSVRVASDLRLTARAVHFVGPFANSGPMPPAAEQTTQYTIIWTATNSSNDMTGARVVGRLPSYVSWLGAVNPAHAAITFNPNTREVTWNVGDILAGTGSRFSPEEVAFQVALTPSLSQINETPVILDGVVIVGEDTFTNTIVRREHRELNTRLTTDPQYQGTQGQVTN